MTFIFVEEITAAFRRFGPLVVDWPHKAESKSYFPPKGNNMDMTLQIVKKKMGEWGVKGMDIAVDSSLPLKMPSFWTFE